MGIWLGLWKKAEEKPAANRHSGGRMKRKKTVRLPCGEWRLNPHTL